jgi:endonuclease-3
MNLFEENNWDEKLNPLIEKYKGKKHPLNYENTYQLMIAVILSAQDSDANINKLTPGFFAEFPNLEVIATSSLEELIPLINKIKNFGNKSNWIKGIAQTLKKDENIPTNLNALIALKGIGRKSANVIIREMGHSAEGIIADLHVIRVAPRIGIIPESKDGNKVEKQLMQQLPRKIWGEIGMAISFLGREICRPNNPKCILCPISDHCTFENKTI